MSETRVSSRPIQSCFQCRKRKIKCSKSYPCTPCILRGEGGACREVDKGLVNGHKKSFDRLEELVDRVQKLENSISVLSTRGTASANTSPPSMRKRELSSSPYPKSPSPSPKRPRSRTSDTSRSSISDFSTPTEEAVRMLEDFAMGRKINRARMTNNSWANTLNITSYADKGTTNHTLSFFADSSQEVVHRLLCLLPAQAQIQVLLQFFVRRVDWYAKVIHVPTFLREVNMVLSHVSNHRYDMINMDFLGLLIIVLGLSFHFADAALCENLFLDATACAHYARHLYSAAHACLQYTNFIGAHTLEHLQTIILMGVYQQENGESDSYWALIGTATKIAQNLGISRLGTETGTRQYPPEWRSPIRREIARRVWWCLVFDDWSQAMAYQGTYSIHPSQNHTGFPANIDDADLVEADTIQSKLLNVHTEMSSFLCRLRFIELWRQMIDEVNYNGGYWPEFALQMETKITEVIGNIESYFQSTRDTRKQPHRTSDTMVMEKNLCQVMGQALLLQLHRPFLLKGYSDALYAHSRDQCIQAAQLILQYLCTGYQAKELLHWPIGVSYGLSAAVVLFIDLCHLRQTGIDTEIEARRKEIQSLLHLFRPIASETMPIVLNTIYILDNLLLTEATNSRDVEHMAPGDVTHFEQCVKRILTDASQGTLQVTSHTDPMCREPSETSFTLANSLVTAQTIEQTMSTQFVPPHTLPPRILLQENQDAFPDGSQLQGGPMTGLGDSFNFNSTCFF